MNLRKNQIITLLFALTFAACSDGPTSASIDYNSLAAVRITDKIVLSSSDYLSADSVGEDIYAINFGNSNTFVNGKLLDVSISYGTYTLCDEEVFILNIKTLRWNQLSFIPNVGVCADALGRQSHLLSTRNFLIENFIDSKGKMLLRSNSTYLMGGRIFEVSPDYLESSTPIVKLGLTYTEKIDIVGDSFWAFSYRDNVFRRQSLDGREILSFKSQTESVLAFSADEQMIWYTDHEGKVFGVDNITGDVKCLFQTTASHPKGLTTNNNALWIVFNSSSKSRLHSYDLSQSCESGVGVLLKNIEFSDTFALGLDWDGSNLLLLYDKLNVIDNEGTFIRAYTLKVIGAYQFVWDGEAVMLFHHGPFPGGSNESIVTRFLLN